MLSDIAQGRRAEQCIAQCMYYGIAVGVGHTTLVMFYFDAAECQLQTFGEPVNVVSVPHAEFFHNR